MDFSQPERAHVAAAGHRLDIRFTGSGSEYFRIWIVNVLLMLVTLGIYYPWAKVRRMRYFHGNTLVGGHPLDFHGDPRKMLRGTALMGALFGLYSVAGHFSQAAQLVALVLIAAVWPALIWSAMRFRLANTSWRGLRLRFSGTLGGAYVALLPMLLPALLIAAAVGVTATGEEEASARTVGFATLGAMAAAVALGPLLWHRLKRFQHDHYNYGQVGTRLDAGVGSFYGVFLRTAGFAAAVLLAGGAVAAGAVFAATGAFGLEGRQNPIGLIIAVAAGMVGAYLLVWLSVGPFFTSRMQNLLWGRTRGEQIAFESRLRFRPLLGLTLTNLLLMVCTLGLYWPFARIALARLRLEAVSAQLSLDPDVLVATHTAHTADATGDAAADVFGIDVGL